MHITLDQIGKRFRYEWILRNVDARLQAATHCAILGPNGTGKSTLLKILSGHLTPSKGTILFEDAARKKIDIDQIYRQIAFAAPYIDLIEEFSLRETIVFYQKFKPFRASLTSESILETLGFANNVSDKQIRFFSSGMKQRLKLVLAICSDTPLLLLDEPTTNLDAQGVHWYLQLIERYALADPRRLVVVASNIEQDYPFCTQQLQILDFK